MQCIGIGIKGHLPAGHKGLAMEICLALGASSLAACVSLSREL